MNDQIAQRGTATAVQPMRPGEILSRAFQLYVRHWRTLLAIMAIALPLAAANLESHAMPGGRHQISVYHNVVATTSTGMSIAAGVVAGAVMLLAFSLVAGAIISAAATASAGADPSVRRSYRFGFTRLGSLVPVIFLLWLAVAAGLTLLILPGLYIGVLLAMSVPALVVEDRRGTKALSRSWALVDGHWWHTFGTIFLTGLLIGVGNIAINGTVGWFIESGWFAQTIAQAASIALTTPLAALVGVLLYLELRARKEHVDYNTIRAELGG